jgi:hypothetical protein
METIRIGSGASFGATPHATKTSSDNTSTAPTMATVMENNGLSSLGSHVVSLKTLEHAIEIMKGKAVTSVSLEELLQFIVHAERSTGQGSSGTSSTKSSSVNFSTETAASNPTNGIHLKKEQIEPAPSTPTDATTFPQSPTFTFKTPSKLFGEDAPLPPPPSGAPATIARTTGKPTMPVPAATVVKPPQPPAPMDSPDENNRTETDPGVAPTPAAAAVASALNDFSHIKFEIGEVSNKSGIKGKRAGPRSTKKPTAAVTAMKATFFATENKANDIDPAILQDTTNIKVNNVATNSNDGVGAASFAAESLPSNPFVAELRKPFSLGIDVNKKTANTHHKVSIQGQQPEPAPNTTFADAANGCATPYRPTNTTSNVYFQENTIFNNNVTATPFATATKTMPSMASMPNTPFPFSLNGAGMDNINKKLDDVAYDENVNTPESTVHMDEVDDSTPTAAAAAADSSFMTTASDLNSDITAESSGQANAAGKVEDEEDDSLLLSGFQLNRQPSNKQSTDRVVHEMSNLFQKSTLNATAGATDEPPLPPTPAPEFKFNIGAASATTATKKHTTPYATRRRTATAATTATTSNTAAKSAAEPPPPPIPSASFGGPTAPTAPSAPVAPVSATSAGASSKVQNDKFALPKTELDVPPDWWANGKSANGTAAAGGMPSMYKFASMNDESNIISDDEDAHDSSSDDYGDETHSDEDIDEPAAAPVRANEDFMKKAAAANGTTTTGSYWGNPFSTSAASSNDAAGTSKSQASTAPFAFPSFAPSEASLPKPAPASSSTSANQPQAAKPGPSSPTIKYTTAKFRSTLSPRQNASAMPMPPPPPTASTGMPMPPPPPAPPSASASASSSTSSTDGPATPKSSKTSAGSSDTQSRASLAELYRKQGKELYSEQEDYEK